MEIDSLPGWLLAATRALHFAACLLLFGLPAFDRLIVGRVLDDLPAAKMRWRRIFGGLLWAVLLLAFLSGGAWLALNAITMSGLPPREALTREILKIVLTGTHFGQVWQFRTAVALAAAAFVLARSLPFLHAAMIPFVWLIALSGALLCASLAWAGHGITGDPQPLHLWADVLHIVIGGFWPAGLLPFAILLAILHRIPDASRWRAIIKATRRFSAISLASVAILLLSGIINTYSLVGSPSLLLSTDYGRVLVAKVGAFCLMVSLGAVNLLRYKPRLQIDLTEGITTEGQAALARLRMNVLLESILSAMVIAFVGIVGLLPPAAEAMMHHHHHP